MKKLTAELIIISLVTVLLLVCINEYAGPPEIERTEQVMGTYATITIIDGNTTRANIAMDAAFDEITRIETLMSLYNESSEVSSLNRAGTNWTALSRDTIYVLKKADYYSRISNGSFDITCNPLLNLWMVKVKKENRMPTPEEIEEAKELVGYDQLVIDVEGNRARFEKE